MLTKFQVEIYHTPGPYKQNVYAGEAYVHSSFWILMKAKFSDNSEPFDYQIQQPVTTEASKVPEFYNKQQFKNLTWSPQINYLNANKEVIISNIPGTDFAKDLGGFRRHRKKDKWYEYDDRGYLKVSNPDSKNPDIKNWDIWLEDEPGFESWEEGDFVIYDFTGTCQVVKVQDGEKPIMPVLIASIGPYTARWRGIWPYRKTNIPDATGLKLHWDGQISDTTLSKEEGYKNEFIKGVLQV